MRVILLCYKKFVPISVILASIVTYEKFKLLCECNGE